MVGGICRVARGLSGLWSWWVVWVWTSRGGRLNRRRSMGQWAVADGGRVAMVQLSALPLRQMVEWRCFGSVLERINPSMSFAKMKKQPREELEAAKCKGTEWSNLSTRAALGINHQIWIEFHKRAGTAIESVCQRCRFGPISSLVEETRCLVLRQFIVLAWSLNRRHESR